MAVGTLTTTTRLVSTMTPPHQRVPIEMQDAVPALRPFGREDVAQLKKDVKFTVDTLRNIRETGPAALDAMAELGPESSGRVLGSTTVNTIATVEGGRGLVTGGIRALRALPGEAGEVGGNLAGMFKGRSGPGSGVLVEPGSTGPRALADGPPATHFDPPLEGPAPDTAAVERQLLSGKEWHDYLASEHGRANVTWESGSGRTIDWPADLPRPAATEMLRVRPPARDAGFVGDLTATHGPRPPDSIAHHVQPLFMDGVDDAAANGAWLARPGHSTGHGVLNPPVIAMPLGSWIIVR